MSILCSIAVLIILFDGLDISEGQTFSPISLSLTSSVDVISGESVCPNTRVEFTCKGVKISVLAWKRSGVQIDLFTFLSVSGSSLQQGPFTLFLDSISLSADQTVANMSSRLVFYITDVNTSDRITCTNAPSSERSEVLNYIRRSAPTSLLPTNFSISLSTVSLQISLSSTFSSFHNVTSYRVIITGSSVANCPSVCLLSKPCQCTNPVAGETVYINITAINCEDQQGSPFSFNATPILPSQPSRCSGLPIYNYKGDFIAIDLLWMRVEDPPEFTSGVKQDITKYSLTLDGISPETVSASTACPSVNCSHIVMLSFPSSVNFRGSVAAENVFGLGQSCTQQFEIDLRNNILRIILSTTDPINRTVECASMSLGLGMFECEFCYSPGTSCRSYRLSSKYCLTIRDSVILPTLDEVSYCYEAKARVNDSIVAVVQGSFSTACVPQALETTLDRDIIVNANFSISGTFSITGGLVNYNGTKEGSVATYQCDKGYLLHGNIHRVCQSDGNWDGNVPMCVFVHITDENIGFLVCSVLLWIISAILVVIETMYILLSPFKKRALSTVCSILFAIDRLTKIVSIILLCVEIVLLSNVVILWILFGNAVGKPSKVLQRDSSIIAAFAISFIAFFVIAISIIIYVVHTFSPPSKVVQSHHSGHSVEVGRTKKRNTTTKCKFRDIDEYADPNEQKICDVVDDHREGPSNRPKRKEVTVKRKAKKNNTFEMQQQVEYNVLTGPGHHIEPHPVNQRTPNSPPKPRQYGTLNMEGGGEEGQHSVPHNKTAVTTRYETMLGSYSQTEDQVKSVETEVREYSVVKKDKRQLKFK